MRYLSDRPLRPILCVLLAGAAALAQAPLDVHLTAAAGTADLGPGYTSETAWLYNGTLPGPVIRIAEGRQLRVHLHNQLSQDTILHVHGQSVHQGVDGTAGFSRPTTASGQEFLYEYDNLEPGTYWFHPHAMHHEQLDAGLHGVLIVDPANTATEPQCDVDQVIVLDDWLQPFGSGYNGHLLNGKSSLGQTPIVVQAGQRLRLRLVNVAATNNYIVALDGHAMTLTHSDGHRVQDVQVQAVPVAIGERQDVIIDCNNPGTWSLAVSSYQNRNVTLVRGVVRYAGQSGPLPPETYVPANLATGSLLDYSQLASYGPSAVTATPTRSYTANLGMTSGPNGPIWTINGQAWPNVTYWPVTQGDIVQLTMTNTTMGMMHVHPMHLHGHSFRVLGTAGGSSHAPIKDTLLIDRMGRPGSSWTVQFTADNPGRWLYHCHDAMHMMNGMMTAFEYTGDADGDSLPDNRDYDPTLAHPVLTIPSDAAAFAPGGSGSLNVQWQPGQWVGFMAGWQELPRPSPTPWGLLYMPPPGMVTLGFCSIAAGNSGSLPYTLPLDTALIGWRLSLQAIAGSSVHALPVLSTYQAFSVC